MTDDIELPPLTKHDHPDAHAWAWRSDELIAIKEYARAAILADRERRVSAEPVAWGVLDSTDESLHGHGWVYIAGTRDEANQHINDALMEPNLVDVARVWVARPLYTAPPPTPPADAQITVEVERGRVWIKRGVQSWMLAYKEDEPAAVEWYAQTLRAALEGK
jgi:hypothetical protein